MTRAQNHTIKHVCGHEQVHRYGGRPDYQQQKRTGLEAQLCPECQHALDELVAEADTDEKVIELMRLCRGRVHKKAP